MKPTYGSLFSGIGGFDLAFDRAGFECKWQVEIEPSCQSVLARHWPNVPKFNDVREVGRKNLERVDVIVGGFPCQDLSVAGKRAGLAGERSGLFYEAARIVEELRPSLVVLENVPGLLSSNAGRDFAAILDTLRDIGARDICWRVLDAQHFGVPQRRRRVFIVGDFTDRECAAEILLESSRMFGHPPPSRETGTRVAAPLTRGSSSGSGVNPPGRRLEDDFNIVEVDARVSHESMAHPSGMRNDPTTETFVVETASTLQGGGRRGHRLDAESAAGGHIIPILEVDGRGGVQSRRDGMGIGADGDPMFTLQSGKQHGICITGNVSHALTHDGHDASEDGTGRGTPLVAYREAPIAYGLSNQPTPKFGNDVFPTLEAKDTGGGRVEVVASPAIGVRRLTPTECERLQGFPDGWTEQGAEGKPLSDSARYRMLGNAVAVPCVFWIAERIYDQLVPQELEAAS